MNAAMRKASAMWKACCDNHMPTSERLERLSKIADSRSVDEIRLTHQHTDPEGRTAIYLAACAGDVLGVYTLVKRHGRDVNETEPNGYTAVHEAAGSGCYPLLHLCSDLGAEMGKPDFANAETPAHTAAADNRVECLAVLQGRSCDMDAVNSSGVTPAFMACQGGHTEALDFLAGLPSVNLNRPAVSTGLTCAYLAAQGGHLGCLRVLSRHGANMAHPLRSANVGATPLTCAAQCAAQKLNPDALACFDFLKSHLDALEYARNIRMHLDSGDHHTAAALMSTKEYSVAHGKFPVLFKGAVVNPGLNSNRAILDTDERTPDMIRKQYQHFNPNCSEPILLAVCARDHQAIHSLVKSHGVDVDRINDADGHTAASLAAHLAFADVLKLLKNIGANLALKNGNGDTPAVQALKTDACNDSLAAGQLACLRILHGSGCSFNGSDTAGIPPLLYAAAQGGYESFRFLMECGDVDVNAVNTTGSNAAIMAAQYGKSDVLELLHGSGCDINKPNKNCDTAAVLAAQNGHESCLAVLHRLGYDLNEMTGDGRSSAVLAAAGKGRVSCIKFLYRNGVCCVTTNLSPFAPLMAAQAGSMCPDDTYGIACEGKDCTDFKATVKFLTSAQAADSLLKELQTLVQAGRFNEASALISRPENVELRVVKKKRTDFAGMFDAVFDQMDAHMKGKADEWLNELLVEDEKAKGQGKKNAVSTKKSSKGKQVDGFVPPAAAAPLEQQDMQAMTTLSGLLQQGGAEWSTTSPARLRQMLQGAGGDAAGVSEKRMKKIKAWALANPVSDVAPVGGSAPLPPCCALCGKTETELAAGEKLRKCGGCGVVRYCSGECQKTAWRVHKKVCVKE